MTDTDSRRTEDGFEYEGRFYRWACSDLGKDLMLIDRISGMPVTEFFETIEDSFDRERAPVLLALIATSIRAGHPEWSVERIHRAVLNLSLSEIVFVDADAEELSQAVPPPLGGETPPSSDEPSNSPSDDSSPSSTPPENSNSPTSFATRA
jgi:hypothetical protein